MIYPTLSTGIAKYRGESAHPDLWDGLVGLWSPELGKQGDRLFDFSGRGHHGTLNSMDAATDYIAGKYGYALNYDGSNDNITTNNIPEINTVSQTMTVMFWVRTTASSNNCILSYDNNDSLSPSSDWYIYTPANLTYGGFCDSNERASGVAINDGKWHHCCIVARQTSTEFWMDGVLRSSATGLTHKVSPTADYTTSHTFRFADNSNVSHFPGDIGEVRLYRRDLSGDQIRRSYLGQSPLTLAPLAQGFDDIDANVSPSVLDVATSVLAPTIVIDCTVNVGVLDVVTSVLAPDVGNIETVNPSPQDVNVEVLAPTIRVDCTVTPGVLDVVTSVVSPTFPGLNGGDYASGILSFNPLVIVTDTDPIKIIRVDVSDPENPTWTAYTVDEPVANAKDVTYDSVLDKIYIACADGQVLEVDASDFTNRTVLDTGDSNDLLLITCLEGFSQVFAGTDDPEGEVIALDSSTAVVIDTDIRFLQEVSTIIETQINTINGTIVETDMRFNELVSSIIGTDIRFHQDVFSEVPADPVNRLDFHVYIDGVEAPDVRMDTIDINHSVGQKSRASFILARRHDKLNYRLDGTFSEITDQNDILITCDGFEDFTGKIRGLDCQSESETVLINAESLTEKADDRRHVTISIPGVGEKLHPYHALVHNPNIDEPYLDPNDENPSYFLGIEVDLGQKKVQNVSRWSFLGDVTITAQKVTDGLFNPKQNWTYFWYAKAENFITHDEFATMRYLGTSPQTLTSDTWNITGLSYWYQREFDDTVSNLGLSRISVADLGGLSKKASTVFADLVSNGIIDSNGNITISLNSGNYNSLSLPGYSQGLKKAIFDILVDASNYFLGSAPFKKISVRNGKFVAKDKWVDENDGLYTVRDEAYDYQQYAKEVAALEYRKIQNINGSVLPVTNATVELFIDGYHYFGISLLSRIHIDNTTEVDIYNTNHGFPVSVKGISISSKTMKVTLTCDNQWSEKELDEIDEERPEEDDPRFLFPGTSARVASKFDPNILTTIE